jgi:hypothetical protein
LVAAEARFAVAGKSDVGAVHGDGATIADLGCGVDVAYASSLSVFARQNRSSGHPDAVAFVASVGMLTTFLLGVSEPSRDVVAWVEPPWDEVMLFEHSDGFDEVRRENADAAVDEKKFCDAGSGAFDEVENFNDFAVELLDENFELNLDANQVCRSPEEFCAAWEFGEFSFGNVNATDFGIFAACVTLTSFLKFVFWAWHCTDDILPCRSVDVESGGSGQFDRIQASSDLVHLEL